MLCFWENNRAFNCDKTQYNFSDNSLLLLAVAIFLMQVLTDTIVVTHTCNLLSLCQCSWAQNRKEWKFQKTRQTWLLQHIFNSEKVKQSPRLL